MRLNARTSPLRGLCSLLSRLRRAENGATLIEFGLIVPFFALTIAAGTELAYFASVRMQVSQIAISVGDNASRLGQEDNGAIAPSVTEEQVEAVMFGAMQEGGEINFEEQGRIILSSLEMNPVGKARLHWQRCQGELEAASVYGKGNRGTTAPLRPFTVSPLPRTGVMVAEVYYHYKPLLAGSIIGNVIIRRESTYMVRDNRNYGSWKNDGIVGINKNSLCDAPVAG